MLRPSSFRASPVAARISAISRSGSSRSTRGQGGVTGRRRVIALRAVISYVLGALQAQHYGPLAGPGTSVLAALPDHPTLAETARQAGRVGPAEEFRGGLDLLLRGLH